ncbi:MAG: hypothetical protein IJK03_04490, partial [Oscillospiraceae bacterium]|nr:hypothetical protein [Oscillospiraceae bacterium]
VAGAAGGLVQIFLVDSHFVFSFLLSKFLFLLSFCFRELIVAQRLSHQCHRHSGRMPGNHHNRCREKCQVNFSGSSICKTKRETGSVYAH